ncbi:MAG: immune inhibitor A [Saprospiraceae bacterium]|nr:immune inhibitor A [Saprospiraceae bacterium]
MRSQLLVLSVFLLIFKLGHSQTHWHKLKIPLQGKTILDLQKTGLAFDHGVYVPGETFTGDFTHEEMEKLLAHGFVPEIVPSRLLIEPRTADPCDSFLVNPPVFKMPAEYPFGSMNGFPTLVEIYESLDLMAELYPHLVLSKKRIGNFLTQEGRPIYYVKISDNPELDEQEPEILYTALHHAREPLSMSQMLFYMWYLLENYNKDPEIKRLVNSRAMYFIPCVNPDGYYYNQETNPRGNGFWRKNRKSLTEGIGVDLNRNYGYQWGINDIGSSPDVDSEVFRGLNPFSEIETQAVKAFCESRRFKIAMNYHSHGDILIVPWGYSNLPTRDSTAYMAIAQQLTRYNQFKVGTTFNTLNYEVNGVSDDWMYGTLGIFSFTPEVGYAFWPDRKDITWLNESTQYMNLMSAWNAGACAQMKDLGQTALEERDGNLEILISRTGLEDQAIKLSASIDQAHLFTLDLPSAFHVGAGSHTVLKIPFTLSSQIKYGDQINIELTLQTGDYIHQIQLSKIYLGRPIWEEDCLDTDQWISSGGVLAATSESFTSEPSSFTDSPHSMVIGSGEIKMRTKNILDLTTARDAKLSFRAKWDLDKEVDFAQIKISEDGVSFIPLCGQYTVLGSAFQDLDKPVYTGRQSDWISEWLDLKPWLGKKIYLQLFVATNYSEQDRDGFYIDDIRVYSDLINSSEDKIHPEEFSLKIYPQPAEDHIQLVGDIHAEDEIFLIDLGGNKSKLWKQNQSENGLLVKLPALNTGLYFIQLIRSDGKSLIQKLTIR